ncbi:MAG: hypothetical protein P8H13_01880 [Polaribacter sp.]|nr:hypothetical protein [Polaribacter sp.]MDG1810671.1 hypothetical protein [Polaribacter sp.]MDG1993520.1 hypothetical protein [Polaribacter sp.]
MKKIKQSLLLTILSFIAIFFYSCDKNESQITEEFSTVKLPVEFQLKGDNSLMNKTSDNSNYFTEDYVFNISLENGKTFDVKFRASGFVDVDGLSNLQIENTFFEKTGLSTSFLTDNESIVKAFFENKLLEKVSCWDQCKEDRRTGFGRALCRTGCVLKEVAKLANEAATVIIAIKLLA